MEWNRLVNFNNQNVIVGFGELVQGMWSDILYCSNFDSHSFNLLWALQIIEVSNSKCQSNIFYKGWKISKTNFLAINSSKKEQNHFPNSAIASKMGKVKVEAKVPIL